MTDYEPLDISRYCNAGPDVYPDGHCPAQGEQTYHGLPFRIDGYVAPGSEPAIIPVGRPVRNVLFAHALLESRIPEGEPAGGVVARYVFVFAGGERVDVPIRERFEVSQVPTAWGQIAFLAVPDRKEFLVSRYEGRWEQTGYRQCEADQGWTKDYYLWGWAHKTPDPEPQTLSAIEIHGNGRKFIVAAITIGSADEDPFRRTAGVPVAITLPKPEDAAAPFALEVDVDRGVATYPYPLPLADSGALNGFGEKQNDTNSPAYVEVSAIPSATVAVKKGGETLGSAKWAQLAETGKVETERVRLQVVEGGRNWVHTTVLDDDTGKPIPCRIHYRSPVGVPYAPHGHHSHVSQNLGSWHIDVGGDLRLGQASYAYIDGRCQGWLPRGEVIVDVARGYEYQPLRTKVEIKPGQRELTLRLKRRVNLNKERYFSGDTHVHFLSTQGALLEASAEDLDVVNLLQSQWGHLFTSTEEFVGRPAVSGDGETIVYASQENRQHILGHLSLLGLKESVMPWCSDGPSEAEMGGNMETTLCHWADACHAQGGTVVIPHFPNPNAEPAALVATGRADALEMINFEMFNHLEYYRYLNGGYRLPLAGGTDKMDSAVPVGLYRTYAYIPPDEPFTYDNWVRALRGGNTFLSGGPIIRFTVDGQPIGSTLHIGSGGTVDVEATSTSILPIHCLQVVQGCGRGPEVFRVVASTEEARGTYELKLYATVKVDGPTWLCARCAGPGYTAALHHHDCWQRGILGHTSPIYIATSGEYDLRNPDTAYYMLTLVEGGLEYVRRSVQWREGTVTHHHGEPDHMAYLERPFLEAIAALRKRL